MLYHMIERYMNNLTKEQINSFAISKGANFSDDELSFVYDFIKKNWKQIIKNPTLLQLERYKNYFSPNNYQKLQQIFQEYSSKYPNFLK